MLMQLATEGDAACVLVEVPLKTSMPDLKVFSLGEDEGEQNHPCLQLCHIHVERFMLSMMGCCAIHLICQSAQLGSQASGSRELLGEYRRAVQHDNT